METSSPKGIVFPYQSVSHSATPKYPSTFAMKCCWLKIKFLEHKKRTALIRQFFVCCCVYFAGTGVPVGTIVLAVMYFAAA